MGIILKLLRLNYLSDLEKLSLYVKEIHSKKTLFALPPAKKGLREDLKRSRKRNFI